MIVYIIKVFHDSNFPQLEVKVGATEWGDFFSPLSFQRQGPKSLPRIALKAYGISDKFLALN